MSKRQNNTLAIFVWLIGLLGFIGLYNPLGFIPLVIPLIFIIIGNKFTKNHAKSYFNVLITGVVLYGFFYLLVQLFTMLKIDSFNFPYLTAAYIYFGLMSLFGLFNALNHRRMNSDFMIKVF